MFINIPNVNRAKLKKASLIKNDKHTTYEVKISPSMIESNKDINVVILNNKIVNFLNVLTKECKNFDNSIFIRNFKNTKFDLSNLREDFCGRVRGSVAINKKDGEFTLNSFDATYHELLHLASTTYGNIRFTPFDEGYTQLLAERYFEEDIGKSYPIQVLILKSIEDLIGREVLEKAYFEGKLTDTIIKYLPIPEGEKNFKKFWKANSLLFEIFESEDNVLDLKNEKVDEYLSYTKILLKDIYNFIFSCLKTKLSSYELNEDKINYLNKFHFLFSFTINGKKIDVFDRKLFDELRNNQELNKKSRK